MFPSNLALKLSVLALLQVLFAGWLLSRGQRYEDFVTTTPLPERHILILGFMGGRDSWDGARSRGLGEGGRFDPERDQFEKRSVKIVRFCFRCGDG